MLPASTYSCSACRASATVMLTASFSMLARRIGPDPGIDVTLKASFGGAAVRVKRENLTLEEVPAGLSLIPDTLFGKKHLGCGRSGIVENRHILHFAVFELPGVKQLGQTRRSSRSVAPCAPQSGGK